MKIYVSNLTLHNNRYYVEGVRHKKNGDKFVSEVFNTSFDKDYFASKVKSIKFPFVLYISLVKGVGAQINEKV